MDVNVGAGAPDAVTVKVPAVATVKVVVAALVITGACERFNVKLAAMALPSEAPQSGFAEPKLAFPERLMTYEALVAFDCGLSVTVPIKRVNPPITPAVCVVVLPRSVVEGTNVTGMGWGIPDPLGCTSTIPCGTTDKPVVVSVTSKKVSAVPSFTAGPTARVVT